MFTKKEMKQNAINGENAKISASLSDNEFHFLQRAIVDKRKKHKKKWSEIDNYNRISHKMKIVELARKEVPHLFRDIIDPLPVRTIHLDQVKCWLITEYKAELNRKHPGDILTDYLRIFDEDEYNAVKATDGHTYFLDLDDDDEYQKEGVK